MTDHRCVAVHENGFRCLLVAHPENVPHYSWRTGPWGGKCDRCGLPAELAHEGCVSAGGEQRRIVELEAELAKLRSLIDSPQTEEFLSSVKLEAAHQVARWGSEHDAGKEPSDWFWLLGYLSGKALSAAIKGDRDKALHHTISSAAALLNWHRALSGASTAMRPGIEPPAEVRRG